MKYFNPSNLPWDEYCMTHLREIAGSVAIALLLLYALQFAELSDGTTITGRITSGGKPVVFGTVTLLASDSRTYSVPINSDGSYEIRNLPPGPVRVSVSSPNPRSVVEQAADVAAGGGANPASRAGAGRPAAGAGGQVSGRSAAKAAGANVTGGVSIAAANDQAPPPPPSAASRPQHEGWFRIPGRYAHPATSGIGTEVRRGRTTLDLSLD